MSENENTQPPAVPFSVRWRKWGIGLVGAVINSVVNSLTIVGGAAYFKPELLHDPQAQNVFLAGLASAAVSGAALYLKQHPLPGTED